MDDDFGDSIDTSSFDDSSPDLSDTGSFDMPDVGSVMDDAVDADSFDVPDITDVSGDIDSLMDEAPADIDDLSGADMGDMLPETEPEIESLMDEAASEEIPAGPEITEEEIYDIPQEETAEIGSDASESADAEIEALMDEAAPEDAVAETEASSYDRLYDYMSSHDYGREDFEEYSKDPEWQELNNAYLEETGREPIDYAKPEETAAETGDVPGAEDVNDVNVPLDKLDSWLSDINPNYDAFDIESPYSNNCGSCAYAVYQRLEGNTDAVASDVNIPYNSDMEALTGMQQVSMSPAEIEQQLLEQGPGAHAIIGIDRSSGPGHWFNAANINGKVVAIDGQDSSVSDWPPDYGDVVNWEMSVKKDV